MPRNRNYCNTITEPSAPHEAAQAGVWRGDIYYVDFGSNNAGSIMRGMHPAMVISNNKGNYNSTTVIVAAISSKLKGKHLPTHLLMEPDCGLKHQSVLFLEQIMTTDKQCLGFKIGRVSDAFLKQVDQALAISVGLRKSYNYIVDKNRMSKGEEKHDDKRKDAEIGV